MARIVSHNVSSRCVLLFMMANAGPPSKMRKMALVEKVIQQKYREFLYILIVLALSFFTCIAIICGIFKVNGKLENVLSTDSICKEIP